MNSHRQLLARAALLLALSTKVSAQRTADARIAVTSVEPARHVVNPAVTRRFDDDSTSHTCAMICSVLVGTVVGTATGGALAAQQAAKPENEDAFFVGQFIMIAMALGALVGALSGAVVDVIRSQF